MRWCVEQVIPMAQFLNAPVVSRFRTYFGKFHDFFSVDEKFILKKVVIPDLKQGHIQADMGWI